MHELKSLEDAFASVAEKVSRNLVDIRRGDIQPDFHCPRTRMLAIQASIVAGHALACLKRARSALQPLANAAYVRGRADAMAVTQTDFHAMASGLCATWLSESERLSFQAAGLVALAKLAPPQEVETAFDTRDCWQLAKPICARVAAVSLVARRVKLLKAQTDLRKTAAAVTLLEQALALARSARDNLREAHNCLRWLKRDRLGNRKPLARALGLDEPTFCVLQLDLATHWVGHAEWLSNQAEELAARACQEHLLSKSASRA